MRFATVSYMNVMDIFKRYDFSFFGISSAIFLLGVVNLYSATYSSDPGLFKAQITYFVLSMTIGVVVSFVNPRNFFRYSYALYVFNIVLLLLVLLLGQKGMGARRWLAFGSFRIQPSEIMKIAVILILARWYTRVNADKDLTLKNLVIPFLLILLPTALIVAEPDLGTGLILLLLFFIISFYRKLSWKSIAIIGLISLLSGATMYKFGLKSYQKMRVMTFLNPSLDAKGSGYNANQSKIAIGSGQFWGKGFKKSSQASLKYLPENHTDFVFSIFNEEHGFFGAFILICLYIILFYRFIWLSMAVTSLFYSIVSIGVMSIFFLHTIINMNMVMGLLPIVGLPLPFFSYGGSSLMTFGICCGLATSISNSRNLF